MSIERILLDLDGTIADSKALLISTANELAKKFKFRTIDIKEIPALQKCNLMEFLKQLEISLWHLPQIIKEGFQIIKERYHEVNIIEGMYEFIRDASEIYRVDMLTNNRTDIAEEFLNRHRLKTNICNIYSHPGLLPILSKARPLARYCRSNNVRPENVHYLGDEIKDYKASRKVGTGITLVSWGLNHPDILRNLDGAQFAYEVNDLRRQFLE
jgi:phosphoglycolate phosphatase